jgi:TIR domain/VHL beta domain
VPKIVISYRRRDSETAAGRIRDRLIVHYGADSIFMDIDTIPFGANFRDFIADTLAHTDVVLAIIGPKWVGGTRRKRPRIQETGDFLRIEVETAFKLGIPVIPVLVEGGAMPDANVLPESLHDLPLRNAATVDSGRDFHPHMDRLVRAIDGLLKTSAVSRASNPQGLAPAELYKTSEVKHGAQGKPKRERWHVYLIASCGGSLVVILGCTVAWLFLPSPNRVDAPPSVATSGKDTPSRSAMSGDPISCDEEQNLRSLGTLKPTSISFINNREKEIHVYWLNQNGNRVLYAKLSKFQSINIQTYISHPWVITDISDVCFAIYMPTPHEQQISISD